MLVMLAEDDEVSRTVVESLLGKWGHEVLIAEDGERASRFVQSGLPFDVAILDWMMPGKAGVDVCRELRLQPREPRPYVMILSAKGLSEHIVEGLDAGADDYLLKPFEPAELAARLRAAERLLKLQKDLLEAREQVLFRSLHDLLTATLNRATILSRIREALGPHGEMISVVAIDLDGFGKINQTHGAAAGDAVLREIASRLLGRLPRGASLGRYDGDCFLVLLSGAGPARAAALAEELRGAVDCLPVPLPTGPVAVTASAAVATPGRHTDLGALLTTLEAALFAARSEGGNQLAVASLLD